MTLPSKLLRKSALLALLAAASLALIIVACGTDDEDEPAATAAPAATMAPTAAPATAAPAPTAAPTPAPTPEAAPELVSPRLIVSMAPPAHQVRLPYMTFQSASGPLHNLYDYLVGKDRKTAEVENTHVAESWSVSNDAQTWTFELKENIPYYMNGKASDTYKFSPEDVRHTWLLQAGIKTERANNFGTWKPWIKSVDDIVIDGNTLTWNLDLVHPDANVYLSEDWTFGILSQQYWDDVGGEDGYIDHPIGMGAWSFVEYVDNEHFLLEKNVGHYRKEPEFDELQFIWNKEAATIMAQILADEVHIGQLPSDLFDEVEARGMKIAKSTLPSFHLWGAIPWYMPEALDGTPTPNYDDTAPTRNAMVRQALNVAIDRERINNSFFKGDAIPSAVSHMAEWWDFFKDEWAPYPGPTGQTGSDGGWPYEYNPERAKELLAEAGYPDGFDLNFYAPNNLGGMPEIPDVGEAITAMWEEIGVNVNLMATEYSAVTSIATERGLTGQIYLIRWSLNPPSPGMGWIWRKATRPIYEYPFITEWKENYDTIADPAIRENLAQDLGDFWRDEYLSIPLLWVFGKAVYNPEVLVEYEVSHVHFGPVRYHEYTVPIYK